MTARPDELGETWRERLARRLAALSAFLTALVFMPVALGTLDPSRRAAMLVVTTLMVVALVWMARRATPQRVRAPGVVLAFVAVALTGYATMGFLSAPAAGFAAATVVSGLLLGRRGMALTIIFVSLAVGAIGILMVGGVIPAPPLDDVAASRAQPWLRSMSLTALLVVIIGAAATWAVETIETAARRADDEARRRREAEAGALRAQSRELIGQLSAGLAHDVNNQLTVIRGWTTLVAGDTPLADREQATEAISAAVTRTTALIKQLLVLGRQDLRAPRPMSLRDFVRQQQRTLQQLLPDDIQVVVESDEDVWCSADEAQVHQVLLNLAVNARDAMREGGKITLRVRSHRIETSEEGVHGAIPAGTWAMLEIEDNGVGMDDATQRRAFEPFFTTKADGKGTGLGLPTVAAIVAGSGGHIRMHTEVGLGTRITMLLPEVGAEAPREAGRASVAPQLRGVSVLLVEDDAPVRDVARRVLEQADAEVSVACDGDEALASIAQGPFDVLCTDAVMPGAPLAEVVASFRRANPGSGVLVCSAHVREDLVRRGIEQGRVDFLAKPYDTEMLVKHVAVAARSGARDLSASGAAGR